MKDYWYDRVQVSIFLCTAKSNQPNCAAGPVTAAQKQQIATQLDSMKPLVKGVFTETQAQAYDRFKQQFKDSPVAGRHQAGRPARELPGAAERPDQVRRGHQLVHRRARRRRGAGPAAHPRPAVHLAEQVHRRHAGHGGPDGDVLGPAGGDHDPPDGVQPPP